MKARRKYNRYLKLQIPRNFSSIYMCKACDWKTDESGRHSSCFETCIHYLRPIYMFLNYGSDGFFGGGVLSIIKQVSLGWTKLNGKNLIRVCSTPSITLRYQMRNRSIPPLHIYFRIPRGTCLVQKHFFLSFYINFLKALIKISTVIQLYS